MLIILSATSADFFPNKAVLVTYFQFLTQLLYKLYMEDYNIISVTMHKDTHIHVPSHVCVRSLPYMIVTRPTIVSHTCI